MKKINLRGLKEVLNEKELKNVMGGSSYSCDPTCSGLCTLSGGGTGNCKIDSITHICKCVAYA
jgi:natural product precursor